MPGSVLSPEHRLIARRPFLLAVLLLAATSCGPRDSVPSDVREAASLLEDGRAAEAYALLEKSIEGKPNAARLVTFAETCERLGRIRRGVRAIEQARELAPDSHRALYVQALLDRDRQRPVDALDAVRAAIALEPDLVEYHLLLGNLLLAAADHPGAVDAFEAAHRLAPDDPRALGGRGQALVLVGRDREGEPLLDRYLERYPDDGEALYLRGVTRFRRKEFDGAEKDFRRAISVAPHLPGPYHNLAQILEATGRREEAATMREQHREVNERDWAIRAEQRKLMENPQDEEAQRTLAKLLRQAGRNAEAAALQERL